MHFCSGAHRVHAPDWRGQTDVERVMVDAITMIAAVRAMEPGAGGR